MIYECRMSRTHKNRVQNQKVKFTDYTYEGVGTSLMVYTDKLILGFERFELLIKHYYGAESTKDYGYGVGYEPLIVGSV